MIDLKALKQVAAQYDITPNKLRGQHFLINQTIVDQIITEAHLNPSDTVLEVGPGLGVLTNGLSKAAGRVIAVEVDTAIVKYLQAQLFERVEVVHDDILKLHREKLGLENFGYKVVANVPYNITAPIIRTFLEPKTFKDVELPRPAELVLMVQKEVAERLTAPAGKLSVIAIAAQFYSDIEYLFTVPSEDFWPQPKVDSAVIRITIKQSLPNVDQKQLFRLVKIGFAARRKQLQNNLSSGLHISATEAKELLEKMNLRADIRAQDLTVEQWIELSKLTVDR
ncbi:MAG: ribosomal RNA small subunit methyltransferase A [Candidatus Buchananbacteria bacterium]|nr:ribosomal RNA small subunit methyltransferase A [Candidatus Buchananbacteria bacterium]